VKTITPMHHATHTCAPNESVPAVFEYNNQQVRRARELVGLKVPGLPAVRISRIAPSKLPAGEWRYFSREESSENTIPYML
jgi:16S rRNA U516 pseudouridylate synthase RsuA-like enzyme